MDTGQHFHRDVTRVTKITAKKIAVQTKRQRDNVTKVSAAQPQTLRKIFGPKNEEVKDWRKTA
jgi:hypothetical protein